MSPGDGGGKDPDHPLNNPTLMREVHFVGRKAVDSSVVALTTMLISQDTFGVITELWLNDNLISDDGAAAIACFLQLPSCALTELWLGNNQIGPVGCALISGALSNNENSRLKSLGLHSNPIGNGGISTLAQMLRRNHLLTTLDVHGCGSRSAGQQVLVTASNGTKYVARVVAPVVGEGRGVVTDQRFLDAVQTFVAFNRINPTREQVIRGLMSSNRSAPDKADRNANFLSELSSKPANERVTDEEKQKWKDCEWKSLVSDFERARVAKSLSARLGCHVDELQRNETRAEFAIDDDRYEEYINPVVETNNAESDGETVSRHGIVFDTFFTAKS